MYDVCMTSRRSSAHELEMAAKLKALQEWCRIQCEGYRDVKITNMTSSWKSGLAFCAILHRYRPDLIDYDSLSKENIFDNNQLAFDVADGIGIPALLDAEDMVAMAVPDKLCIITYVAQYYMYFRSKTPSTGEYRKRKKSIQHSANDLNQLRSSPAKQFKPPTQSPNSSPVRNFDSGSEREASSKDPQIKTDNNVDTDDEVATPPPAAYTNRRRGSVIDDVCHVCHDRVYVLERHLSNTGQLYHRRCFRRDSITGGRRSSITAANKENIVAASLSSPVDSGNDVGDSNRTMKTALGEWQHGNTVCSSEFQSRVHPVAGRTHNTATSGGGNRPLSMVPEDRSSSIIEDDADDDTPGQIISSTCGSGEGGLTSPAAIIGNALEAAQTTARQPLGVLLARSKSNISRSSSDQDSSVKANVASDESMKPIGSFSTHHNNLSVDSSLLACISTQRCETAKTTSVGRHSASTGSATSCVNNSSGNGIVTTSGTTCATINSARTGVLQAKSPAATAMEVGEKDYIRSLPCTANSPSNDNHSSNDTQPISSTSFATTQNHQSSTPSTYQSSLIRETFEQRTDTGQFPSVHQQFQAHTVGVVREPSYNRNAATTRSNVPSTLSQTLATRSAAKLSWLQDHNSDKNPVFTYATPAARHTDAITKFAEMKPTQSAHINGSLIDSVHAKNGTEKVEIGLRKHPTTLEMKADSKSTAGLLESSSSESGTTNASRASAIIGSKTTAEENDLLKKETRVTSNQSATVRTTSWITPNKSINITSTTQCEASSSFHSVLSNSSNNGSQMTRVSCATSGITTAGGTAATTVTTSQRSTAVTLQRSATERARSVLGQSHTGGEKLEWQLEVERRLASRKGVYVDPQISIAAKRSTASQGSSSGTSQLSTGAEFSREKSMTPDDLTGQKKTVQNTTSSSQTTTTTTLPKTIGDDSAIFVMSTQEKLVVTNHGVQILEPAVHQNIPVSPTSHHQAPLIKSHFSLSFNVDDTSSAATSCDSSRRPVCSNGEKEMKINAEKTEEKLDKSAINVRKVAGAESVGKLVCSDDSIRVSRRLLDLAPRLCISTDDLVSAGDDKRGKSVLLQLPRGKDVFSSADDILSASKLKPTRLASKVNGELEQSKHFENTSEKTESGSSHGVYGMSGTSVRKSSIAASEPRTNVDLNEGSGSHDANEDRLDEIDFELCEVEMEGRILEERIRGGSGESVADDEDDLMAQWCNLVKKRNELVAEESMLIYKQQQMELEELQGELKSQLRNLLRLPSNMKTADEKSWEECLTKELIETVARRNSIIDNMEHDRMRFLQEDEQLEAMMTSPGFARRRRSSVLVGVRPSARRRKSVGKVALPIAGQIKAKKKLASILANKKSSPSKKPYRSKNTEP